MNKIWGATVALGAAVLLAGCSGDDNEGGNGGNGGDAAFAERPVEEIVETAQAAMLDLSAVHVVGEITSEGEVTAFDMQTSASGNCTGTLDAGQAGTIEILGTGGDVWFKASEEFMANFPAEIQELAAGKWIADSDGSFSEFCDLEVFLDELVNSEDDSEESYENLGTEELDGEEVVKIQQDDAEDGVSHAYIQTGGEHLFVKIEKPEGESEDAGSATFSEFNEEFEVQAPAADEVVDLSQLG